MLVVVAMVIVILAILTPHFKPRPDFQAGHDEVNNAQLTNTDTDNNETEVTTNMPTTVDIASTTSAFPFVQRWVAQYEDEQLASLGKLNVDYLDDGEINADDSKRNDLAIVGIPDEMDNGTMYVPVSAQAVAIVYNIPSFPDIPSGLRLNSTILSLILNGNITQWDDKSIKELNPGLNLPNARIIVVHDDEDYDNQSKGDSNSSTQLLLSQYLGLEKINWPKNGSVTASGPAELAEIVRKTPYSIGYIDFSYAVQTRMTYAAIGDAQGDYNAPSIQSIGKAVDLALQFHNSSEDQMFLQQGLQQPVPLYPPPTINASRIVNESYPMVGLYYAAMSLENIEGYTENEEGKRTTEAVLDFVKWVTSEDGGQQALPEVQYPSIYSGNNQLGAYTSATIQIVENALSNR